MYVRVYASTVIWVPFIACLVRTHTTELRLISRSKINRVHSHWMKNRDKKRVHGMNGWNRDCAQIMLNVLNLLIDFIMKKMQQSKTSMKATNSRFDGN